MISSCNPIHVQAKQRFMSNEEASTSEDAQKVSRDLFDRLSQRTSPRGEGQ